jgi:hypothetical protein
MKKTPKKVAQQVLGTLKSHKFEFWDNISQDVKERILTPQEVSGAIRKEVQQWVEALENEKYAQGHAFLKRKREEKDYTEYCCLGVLCELAEVEFEEGDVFPYSLKDEGKKPGGLKNIFYEMAFYNYHTPSFARLLADLNDSDVPFKNIAKLIKYKYGIN